MPKKVPLKYYFKCKLYFEKFNYIDIYFFNGRPDEDFFLHLHARKQEYYFFWSCICIAMNKNYPKKGPIFRLIYRLIFQIFTDISKDMEGEEAI